VTLGHLSCGAQRGRFGKFEADEPAGRIPPGEEIELGTPATSDVGDVDTRGESLVDPRK